MIRPMTRNIAAALLAALAVTGCATNPVSGRPNVVMGTQQGEKEQARRYYEQIIRAYGLYEDQALQDYVQMVGAKVAKNSHLPDWEFKFTVLDDESVNAFTTGGGYVYIHRGLMSYLTTEAELATVLGHEIGHVTARHPARRQTRGVLASVLATGVAIMTGSGAVAQLANIGAEAWLQGYGRENEMEADKLEMLAEYDVAHAMQSVLTGVGTGAPTYTLEVVIVGFRNGMGPAVMRTQTTVLDAEGQQIHTFETRAISLLLRPRASSTSISCSRWLSREVGGVAPRASAAGISGWRGCCAGAWPRFARRMPITTATTEITAPASSRPQSIISGDSRIRYRQNKTAPVTAP
jgi:Zn-dependent protease with chaperone function